MGVFRFLLLGVYLVDDECCYVVVFFFFQAEDGIRDLVRSRGSEMCIRDSHIGTQSL
mgnify:CR=1 FL=1